MDNMKLKAFCKMLENPEFPFSFKVYSIGKFARETDISDFSYTDCYAIQRRVDKLKYQLRKEEATGFDQDSFYEFAAIDLDLTQEELDKIKNTKTFTPEVVSFLAKLHGRKLKSKK